MNVNGFEVDKFNVHNIPENTKYSTCPECSAHRKPQNQRQKCMTLHWDTGIGVCHHCGAWVQLHTYKKKNEVKEYKKPEKWNNTELSDKVVKWFEKRGISQFTLRQMKVSEGIEYIPQVKANRNTIQFNYFENGEITNIKYRDGAKNFKLYSGAKLVFYNIDAVRTSKEVLICEGEIDQLSYYEAGCRFAVSTPNGSTLKGVNLEYLDNCIDCFDNKEKIYLALDNDEAGRNVTKELIRRLGAERCFLVDFSDCKDANEYLIKNGIKSLAETITNAKEIPIEGVTSVLDWESEYDEYLVNGMRQGYGIGKKSFDGILSTYTGQYITVTGVPSSGKSDFVDEMCIGYNLSHGWKIAYASPENRPSVIHAGKIEAKLVGQWVNRKEQLSQMWHKSAKEHINDNFKFIDLESYDLEDVLAKTKQLIRKFGIKCLVIDPYNKVRLKRSLNKNITEYTNDYHVLLDEFARKNDILIILVAHPRKPEKGEAKSYEPTFYDIKGGGEFYDMSPHGLLVHRDYATDSVKIKVLKVKFSHLGENNAFRWFKWNINNGRYSEFGQYNELPELCEDLRVDNSNWFSNEEKNVQQSVMELPTAQNAYIREKEFTDQFGNKDLPF